MALRPIWKGYLKLSLVSCAVELTNATTFAEKVRFRTLNRATGHPVKRQYVDSVTGKPVKDEDEVKGFETGDDEYVLVEDKEIDAVQIESSHTLAIDQFVDKSSIEQIYLDAPYYLTPADKVSQEAFAVIRAAMAEKKMAAIAKIVLFRRERPVVIEALGAGLLLTTLRFKANVRDLDEVFDDIPKTKLDADMVALAGDIIDRKAGRFDPSGFEDEYENALVRLVKSKQAGKTFKAPKSSPRPENVVNLFEALQKSLGRETGSRREPAARRASASRKAPASRARSPGRRSA
ncbi:MAG: Ku protein [Rhizobiales bacterium 65-9]|nr:Ku protein [Hyphomicrobiales bacterium]OJY36707.1 MAG: Ku protein [Rhizobiales bacterium 65-9]